ncbi:MAG: hypothetical protein KBS40_02755 [Bacteroidales bacterium]|nr:hypothetical protein [Bacteroidales bacterium]
MKEHVQFILAVMMCTAGIVVIILCLYIDPEGEIHTSVLVAYGETLTFVGAIMGIDYKYKFNQKSKKP